jgi:hypothetical protein
MARIAIVDWPRRELRFSNESSGYVCFGSLNVLLFLLKRLIE